MQGGRLSRKEPLSDAGPKSGGNWGLAAVVRLKLPMANSVRAPEQAQNQSSYPAEGRGVF